jgi:hypothetical protein
MIGDTAPKIPIGIPISQWRFEMSNIRIDLNDHEAELLYQALVTLINASSPELMQRTGWEGADEITATTLIQSIFDGKDIETLMNIAAVMAPQILDPIINYSAYDVQDPNTSVWSGDPLAFNNDISIPPIPQSTQDDAESNVVTLDAFRNKR